MATVYVNFAHKVVAATRQEIVDHLEKKFDWRLVPHTHRDNKGERTYAVGNHDGHQIVITEMQWISEQNPNSIDEQGGV